MDDRPYRTTRYGAIVSPMMQRIHWDLH